MNVSADLEPKEYFDIKCFRIFKKFSLAQPCELGSIQYIDHKGSKTKRTEIKSLKIAVLVKNYSKLKSIKYKLIPGGYRCKVRENHLLQVQLLHLFKVLSVFLLL